MIYRLLFIAFFTSLSSFAQKATISGTITDKEDASATLPFANVTVKGTTNAATTDENGKYSLVVDAGTHTLEFSFVGYEPVEETVTLAAGQKISVDTKLASGSYTIKDIVVQQQSNREKESALLLEQKNAVSIKQSIGAQELSRKGVGDVATAVTKTSGITRQEGSGNIFVRGLGDRYNATSMNGLPIASNDPERKNIDLKIFPTEIVEFISIDKVYNGEMSGDFGGANIDIVSKDFKGKGRVDLQISSAANTNAISRDNFLLSKGPDFFGFKTAKRPETLGSFAFQDSMDQEEKAPFGGSIALSGGNSYAVGQQGRFSFFLTGSFANEFSALRNAQMRSVNNIGIPTKNFEDYQSVQYTASTTGMANLGYRFNPNHKLAYNFLFINSSTQESEDAKGLIVDVANEDNGLQTRRNFNKNTLFVHQLLGENRLTNRIDLNWGASHNSISGDMPDRIQNTFRREENGYLLSNNSETDNHRYFHSLTENEIAGKAEASYKFGLREDETHKAKFTLGYSGRFKTRDFEATQFNFGTSASQALTVVDPANLDAFYNQENFSNGYFNISTFRGQAGVPGALDPQTYAGEQTVNSIYGMLEYKLGERWTALLGIRGEVISQGVEWTTQIDPIKRSNLLEKNAVLPSVILKYAMNDRHNFRFAASKTYTLPQFKERARFVYERMTESFVGNPDLYPSDNYNADIKWEFFPKNDEILSVTGFGKYIRNPINEFLLNSSAPMISWANTGDFGYAAGAELEIRKNIYNPETQNANKVSAGFNASYTYTTQELDDEKVARETLYPSDFTDSKSSFAGASDLLVNADISYLREWNDKNNNISATLAYTHFSDRIYALGTNGRGNMVDKAVGTLDFIVKSKLSQNLTIGVSAKNLLDPKIERVQENKSGDVTVLTYQKGVNLNLNINYQF